MQRLNDTLSARVDSFGAAKVIGTLAHVSRLRPMGPLHMRHMYIFQAKQMRISSFRKIQWSVRASDKLRGWLKVIKDGLSLPLAEPLPVHPMDVYTDASTS